MNYYIRQDTNMASRVFSEVSKLSFILWNITIANQKPEALK